ncbi:hypothetical protein KSS87_010248 [Heliosperma pusillum]|nr:hypothetical protein KSS87_010248 [Heliosperma pusillum]
MFGSTAMQFQEKKFDIGFARLGEMDRDAQHYVADVGIEKWSICHDGGHRYGILTTNLAEAFNNVLKGARFLPITALVQCIFFRVNAYFVERREEARKRLLQGQHYSSKITHLLEENCKKGAYHKVVSFDHVGGLYQVTTRRGSRNVSRGSPLHTVDLSKRTCTCNKFQTYKYPCSHVYAVCKKMKLNASQFVEISYTTGDHLASYASKLHPLKDEAYWGHYNGPRIVCDEGKRRGKGSMEYRLQPGPVNPEVLTQQETHRSKAIWDGDDKGSLRCRSHLAMHKGFLAHGFAEVHRTCNTEIQAMPQEVPPHYRNIMSNIRDNTSQSLEHVGYSHLLQQFHQPTQETQVEEQHEERGDGSTMQESTAEDDETLQVFRRRSRRTNTSMSPINEQGNPEPSKAKKIWSRLRGKKKT